MKRPLVVFALIYFTVLACSVCLISQVNLTLSIMVTFLGIVAILIKREYFRTIILIVLPISLGFLIMWHEQCKTEAVAVSLGTQTCTISGEITDIPRRQFGRWYYVVQTDRIDISGATQKVRLRLSCRHSIEAAEGDRITATVTFLSHDSGTGYNSRTALLADGIRAQAWCSPYTEVIVNRAADPSLRYLPLQLRRSIISAIRRTLPGQSSGMLCAMLLGDTDELDRRIADNFRAAGIAHLLAVSGFHVSLLAGALNEGLRKLRCTHQGSVVITMCFIFLFMAVTGFSPSATRAGIMYLMALTADLLHRDADGLTSMSVGVLALLLWNPLSAADIGLQLSVASTFGLLLFSDPIKECVSAFFEKIHFEPNHTLAKKCKTYLIDSLTVSLTACLFTLPLTALHFGNISLIAPLTNLLCVYAATLFIVMGVCAVILGAIPFVGFPAAFPLRLTAGLLCQYLDTATQLLSHLPLASANVHGTYTPYFLAFAAAILLSSFLLTKYAPSPDFIRYAMCVVFFTLSLLLMTAMTSHRLMDTGAQIKIFGMQDAGVCVCAKNGMHAVIAEAGGDNYDLHLIQDSIAKDGIQKIDALAVSEKSDPRSSMADGLIDTYAPDYFFCGDDITAFPLAQKASERRHTQVMPFGGTVRLPGLTLDMYTDGQGEHWQRLNCGELTILVCPDDGDCANLPQDYLTCDAVVISTPPKNITYLCTGAVIITSDCSDASETAYRLHVKGFQHTYITVLDGTLTCAMIDGNLHIQKGDRSI